MSLERGSSGFIRLTMLMTDDSVAGKHYREDTGDRDV